MTTMPFKFPIMVIPTPGEMVGWAGVECHSDDGNFLYVSKNRAKAGGDTGAVVVDLTGRSWKLTGLRKIPPKRERFWIRALVAVIGLDEIEYDIQELHLSLDEIKYRVCEGLQAYPDNFRDDEAVAGEAGPPRDEQEMLDGLKANVLKALTVLEIMAVIQFIIRD